MRIVSKRWLVALAGLACYAGVAWYFGGDAHAQRKVEPRGLQPAKDTSKSPAYYGSVACSNKGCHGGDPPKLWIRDKELLVRGTEALIWNKCDKHADAYKALTGPRGKQMAKILGYDVTDPKGKGRACLVCHAAVIDDPKVLAASKENYFDIKEGVTCVVCHGAAGDWVAVHGVLVTAARFRRLTPEEKESRYGMRNLWDPVKRTELCTSCHVGSQKEGKFVTHEMYAAGHPPLPAFEVSTFSDQMPRHWQYRSEKSRAIQKELGLRPDERERTQMVLVGAIVALRDTMALLAGQAGAAAAATSPDEQEMDLSNFDCYACHHGIRSKSWQQERMAKPRVPGWVPGRVPMRGWSTELIRLAIQHFCVVDETVDCKALEKEFHTLLTKVEQAFNARAFGAPAQVREAALELYNWADGLAKRINAIYPNTATTRKLLAKMPALYDADRLLDYDSARQVSWGYYTMDHELYGPKGNPAVRSKLEDIDKVVKLRLPEGRDGTIERELKDSLERIKEYDARCFQRLFKELGAAK
jgi:hypothetical protein